MTFSLSPARSRRLHTLRVAAAGLLAYGLLVPAATIHATTTSGTGTLIGTVTCGDTEETPASPIVVIAEGLHLQTHTDQAGRFRLTGVPATVSITIDAVGDATASRYNVVVQPGEILDIGSMDMIVCPQPSVVTPDAPTQQEPYRDTPDQG